MSNTLPLTNLIPVAAQNLIEPSPIENLLAPPYDVTVTYHSSTKVMNLAASIMIPVEIDVNDVRLEQYYISGDGTQLQYYFTYDLPGDGSGEFQEMTCAFNAITESTDGKEIDLSTIVSTFMLVCDTDPKTSRGTVTTVRSVLDI